MILNFSELRVHLERCLRGVVYGMARAVVKLGKKLHTKLRRTSGDPQSSLFFNLVRNSPTNPVSTSNPVSAVSGGPCSRSRIAGSCDSLALRARLWSLFPQDPWQKLTTTLRTQEPRNPGTQDPGKPIALALPPPLSDEVSKSSCSCLCSCLAPQSLLLGACPSFAHRTSRY